MKPIDFIKIAVRDYKNVGAVAPTSKYTVKKVIKGLKPEYKYIIEYGAGSGVFTKEILNVLPHDGKIIAIEMNSNFLKELSKIKDGRLIVLSGDVTKISRDFSQLGLPRVDVIVSGIPISFLKPLERKELVKNTHDILEGGGRFIVYQYSLKILPILKDIFREVSYSFEPRNLPPCFVMIGGK